MKATRESTVCFEEIRGDLQTLGLATFWLLLGILRGDQSQEGQNEIFTKSSFSMRSDLGESFDEFTLNPMFIPKGRITRNEETRVEETRIHSDHSTCQTFEIEHRRVRESKDEKKERFSNSSISCQKRASCLWAASERRFSIEMSYYDHPRTSGSEHWVIIEPKTAIDAVRTVLIRQREGIQWHSESNGQGLHFLIGSECYQGRQNLVWDDRVID